jgi:hypothetical protein
MTKTEYYIDGMLAYCLWELRGIFTAGDWLNAEWVAGWNAAMDAAARERK